MKDMLSKEHYCCKINNLLMKSSVSPHLLWFFKSLNSLINRGWGMGGGWWVEEGGRGVHTVNGVQMI